MINVGFQIKKQLPGAMPLPIGNFYGECYAFTGMVTEVHPEDNTVHVRAKTGRVYSGLRVASLEWVTIDEKKGFLSGQRRLPPVNTFVLCLMQTDDPNTAIVLCSLFGYQVADHAAFKEDSEDAAHTRKRVTNSGWIHTEDNRTGTVVIQNKEEEPEIKIEIDLEDKENFQGTITFYDNVLTVDKKKGIILQSGENVLAEIDRKTEGSEKVNVKVNENKVNIDTEKGITAETDKDVFLKCSKTGTLEIGNAIATLGAMISDFLQAAVSFKSVGSPGAHTAPDFSAAAVKIIAQWDQVFK